MGRKLPPSEYWLDYEAVGSIMNDRSTDASQLVRAPNNVS